MRLKLRTVAVLLVASLAWVPAASAATVKIYAPPGKAGTSEYSEVVPTAGGNVRPPAMTGSNSTGGGILKLGSGKQAVEKLSKLGKQGAAASQFVQATAPAVVQSRHGLGPQPAAPRAVKLGGSGGSALGGIGDLLGGSDAGGIGAFLPLLLAFGLGAAVAISLLRLRRGRQPPA